MVHFLLSFLLICCTHLYSATIDPELVDIQAINPSIVVELFLANPDNPLGKQLYPSNARAYIDKKVAFMLDRIQKELQPAGLGLKIKDAYRPLAVQKQLWHLVLGMQIQNPENYISNPDTEGGRHPRGVAVDLTIIHLADGIELAMPPFAITEKAHHGYVGDLTDEQIKNREFLKDLMIRHGFAPIRCEWWHYNLPDWQEYTVLDITLDALQKE